MRPSPDLLLSHPEVVTPASPWCVELEGLELAVLLLTQPWVAAEGLRRADLERQLQRLGGDLPLGPVYFQRVKRAVAHLAEIGALRATEESGGRRFVATPRGFAAYLLNLCVLRADPTVDGSEFELKRALVAMWNLVFERLAELPDEVALPPEVERFFAEVESLQVLGGPVIGDEVMSEALDVLRLVARQRRRVEGLLGAAKHRLQEAETAAGALRDFDLSGSALADTTLADPAVQEMVRELAGGVLPRLSLGAAVRRYESYLAYLDDLAALYAAELKTVELASLRQALTRRRA